MFKVSKQKRLFFDVFTHGQAKLDRATRRKMLNPNI